MEVSAEAKRIMVVALGKLYSSRTQRGGLRLHRSLLLTLVMKSARDIYHAAQTTADSFGTECEQQNQATEVLGDSTNTHVDLQNPESGVKGQTEATPREEVTELRHDAQTRTDDQNKENAHPNSPAQQSRKRRGKVCATPDFLPCKKAKLEQNCPQQLAVNPVLMDYVNCGSILSAPPTPMPLLRPIAAC